MPLPTLFALFPLGTPYLTTTEETKPIDEEVQGAMLAAFVMAMSQHRAMVCVTMKTSPHGTQPIALGCLEQVALKDGRVEFQIQWSNHPLVGHLRGYWETTKVEAEPGVGLRTVSDAPPTFEFAGFHLLLSPSDLMGFEVYLRRVSTQAQGSTTTKPLKGKDRPS